MPWISRCGRGWNAELSNLWVWRKPQMWLYVRWCRHWVTPICEDKNFVSISWPNMILPSFSYFFRYWGRSVWHQGLWGESNQLSTFKHHSHHCWANRAMCSCRERKVRYSSCSYILLDRWRTSHQRISTQPSWQFQSHENDCGAPRRAWIFIQGIFDLSGKRQYKQDRHNQWRWVSKWNIRR